MRRGQSSRIIVLHDRIMTAAFLLELVFSPATRIPVTPRTLLRVVTQSLPYKGGPATLLILGGVAPKLHLTPHTYSTNASTCPQLNCTRGPPLGIRSTSSFVFIAGKQTC